MATSTKLTLIALLPADERALSEALKRRVPDIRFVDDSSWPSPEPPCKESIEDCASRFVFLWSPSVVPYLPAIQEPRSGRYVGPQSGVVVQLIRSTLSEPYLTAGQVSVGWEDPNMGHFVRAVWRAIDDVAPNRPVGVDPQTLAVLDPLPARFRVGAHAAAWCASDPRRFIRDNTRDNRYRAVASSPPITPVSGEEP
jgi:hypothetical protein